MEIIKSLKRPYATSFAKCLRLKTRIKEYVVKNTGRVIVNGIFVYYTAKVQVKILGVWVTVWAETCDYSDGDTRPYIKNRAEEVRDALTDKI